MEETEKNKMVRTKKVSETGVVHQIMTAMAANTIREIARTANERGIKREDIVSLLKENSQFVLVYYR